MRHCAKKRILVSTDLLERKSRIITENLEWLLVIKNREELGDCGRNQKVVIGKYI